MDLPVVNTEPLERADAQRNRKRIICAAERLVAEHGVGAVSLDRIADEAGVGKGTVFRRFGDRNGLLHTLLSDREAAFQEALIRGEPPLGPGAPAAERLLAFGPAYLRFVADNADLLSEIEAGRKASRHSSAPYGVLRAHLRSVVADASPAVDADYLADALLAPLAANLVLHQLRDRGMTPERLAAGWQALAAGLLEER